MAYYPAHCDHNCKDCSQNSCGWCGFLDIPVEGYDFDYNTSTYTYANSDKYPKKEEYTMKEIDTWFNKLQVGDMVKTAYGKEVIRKKYDDMLGFDANGRTNLNADGLYPIAISGCRPIAKEE